MTIIPIDRKSIKKNHNAGRTSINVPGNITCGFRFDTSTGRIPENLLSKCIIVEWNWHDDPAKGNYQRGYIHDPNDFKLFAEIKGISIETNLEKITIHSYLKEPKWLYEHDTDTMVPCKECGNRYCISDIRLWENYDDDNDEFSLKCPSCDGWDTFEYRYELIDDNILKEVGLK